MAHLIIGLMVILFGGDGKTIRFWEDNWVDDQSLQQKYPRLYMLSLCKDKTVKEVSDWV